MPCLGRLDGNVSCFQITNFTYHDDVRILPKKGPEGDCKSQTSLVIHIDLVDARQVDFSRIFRCGYIDPRFV